LSIVDSLSSILDKLNLSEKEGLFFCADLENSITDFLPIRVKETLSLHIKPDAFFCINQEPLILFFDNKNNLQELEKQIWNFNQSPAIFINEGSQWIIKNGFKLLESKQGLEVLSDNVEEFDYFKIITGKSWEQYKKDFEQKNRVDYFLLKNIEDARNVLIDTGSKLRPKIANSLIGRIIFIRYLIDRKVELKKYGIMGKEDFYKILSNKNKTYTFFKQIKSDFNGNLFPLEYEIDNAVITEKDFVDENHLSKIIELLKGGIIHSNGTYQSSLFDIYDFSIIPVEFVSNVYEKFIGVENQAEKGAYYTPLFLVDYIQKQTISNYFRENPSVSNCKVLDPACGSGIFLVESLRQIISQYKILNPDFKDTPEKYSEYKAKIKELLTDSIFGVDKDDSAISVAVFSLYITLLDNLSPKSIVDFQFPPIIGSNLFCADFFDEEHIFNEKLKKHNFQYIVGNPPWATKHPKSKQLFETYIEKRKEREKSNLEIVHREIAEAFLARVSDFNFEETAFIVVSKILYKLEKNGVFRNYFLNNFSIRQVVELSSVRQKIFNQSNDSAVAPAAIIFYSKSNSQIEKNNLIKHISLKPNLFFEFFKLMVIEKYDIKELTQQSFIDEDWIWKVLVYGNILDYYFIQRLKTKYQTIEQITSDQTKYIKGQGLKFNDSGRKIDTKNFKGYKFIGSLGKKLNTKGKMVDERTNYSNYLMPYYLTDNLNNWDGRDVGYFPEDVRIFKTPCLLITGGTNNTFKSVSAISYSDTLFKSSLTSIKSFKKDGLKTIKAISAIINSTFFSYFIISNGSSAGIEREETHDEEKWNTPYAINDSLIQKYEKVEQLTKNLHTSIMKDYFIESELNNAVKELDKEIIKLFKVSKQESSLIDYATEISIPLLKGTDKEKSKVTSKLKFQDSVLKKYAQIFIGHFGKRFKSDGNYFEVEIMWSESTILIKFKIIPNPSNVKDGILWSKLENENLLAVITSLGFENLSDNLYLQKDIKGFEEDFFYVAKPNQFKSWHTALAYLDLSEFIEAFFKIGSGEKA